MKKVAIAVVGGLALTGVLAVAWPFVGLFLYAAMDSLAPSGVAGRGLQGLDQVADFPRRIAILGEQVCRQGGNRIRIIGDDGELSDFM